MTEITKKQYILSSQKLDVDMRENRVGEWYLYTDTRLSVSELETADGKKLWLLGNAFCTDSVKSAKEDIEAFSGDDLNELTRFWTGRWAVVTETELFTDATGLMSAFYSEDGAFVSSSLAVMADLLCKKTDGAVKAAALSWQILPHTLVGGVNKLLATQKLTLSNGRAEAVFNNRIKDYRELSTEERCQKTADILANAVKSISAFSGKNITLALTGGKDSRLTFSALVKAGVPFLAYTAEHERISKSDKNIPKLLAERFGIEHKFIKRERISGEMLSDYYRFSAGNSKGADASFYACNQFSSFKEDTLIIRSGIFEAAQRYARGYTRPDADGFAEDMTAYYTALQQDQKQKTAFAVWLETVKKDPIDYIDLRDRFYIEQRVGGWAAAIEQSFDICDFTSVQIANCAELLSIFLSCNDEERKSCAISYETMKLLEPNVLCFAVNQRSFSDKLIWFKDILRNPIKKFNNLKNRRKGK